MNKEDFSSKIRITQGMRQGKNLIEYKSGIRKKTQNDPPIQDSTHFLSVS
jgi:hypothetical protein